MARYGVPASMVPAANIWAQLRPSSAMNGLLERAATNWALIDGSASARTTIGARAVPKKAASIDASSAAPMTTPIVR